MQARMEHAPSQVGLHLKQMANVSYQRDLGYVVELAPQASQRRTRGEVVSPWRLFLLRVWHCGPCATASIMVRIQSARIFEDRDPKAPSKRRRISCLACGSG